MASIELEFQRFRDLDTLNAIGPPLFAIAWRQFQEVHYLAAAHEPRSDPIKQISMSGSGPHELEIFALFRPGVPFNSWKDDLPFNAVFESQNGSNHVA